MEIFGTMVDRVVVPEGEYIAELTACSEQASIHGPVNKYEFRLIGEDGIDGRKVTGLTPTTMMENSKKARWDPREAQTAQGRGRLPIAL